MFVMHSSTSRRSRGTDGFNQATFISDNGLAIGSASDG